MLVSVTERDIGQGWKNSCKKCPVALALGRSFPERELKVGSLLITDEKTEACYKLPKAAREFISLFDGGEPVEPFSFEVIL